MRGTSHHVCRSWVHQFAWQGVVPEPPGLRGGHYSACLARFLDDDVRLRMLSRNDAPVARKLSAPVTLRAVQVCAGGRHLFGLHARVSAHRSRDYLLGGTLTDILCLPDEVRLH